MQYFTPRFRATDGRMFSVMIQDSSVTAFDTDGNILYRTFSLPPTDEALAEYFMEAADLVVDPFDVLHYITEEGGKGTLTGVRLLPERVPMIQQRLRERYSDAVVIEDGVRI